MANAGHIETAVRPAVLDREFRRLTPVLLGVG